VATILDPKVDGSYVIHVTDVAPGAEPPVTVTVVGTTVGNGPISTIGAGNNKPPPVNCSCSSTAETAYRNTALILAAIALAGALVMRRRTRPSSTN
jgi:MYXO-CTERM domain-containing protein